jgi:hypothetical protein
MPCALKGGDHARANVVAVRVAANNLEDIPRIGTVRVVVPGRGSGDGQNIPGGVTMAMVQIKRTGAGDGEWPRTIV